MIKKEKMSSLWENVGAAEMGPVVLSASRLFLSGPRQILRFMAAGRGAKTEVSVAEGRIGQILFVCAFANALLADGSRSLVHRLCRIFKYETGAVFTSWEIYA